MQAGLIYSCRTVSTRDFLEALAQDAASIATIQLPDAIGGSGTSRAIIRHLTILSVQNLAWEVVLYRRSSFHQADIDSYSILSRMRFTATDGVLIPGSGFYAYLSNNVDLPYADDDRLGRLYLMLINHSAGAKSAGAAGAVVLELHMEPTYG